MEDNLSEFEEVSIPTSEENSNFLETFNFPQSLVTEKIIFCVDVLLLAKKEYSNAVICNLLKSYFSVKKKICVKPPEFECLLVADGDTIVRFKIHSVKDIQFALKFVENIRYEEEKKSLEIDSVFNYVASLVELPDPNYYKECIPPNWVYHVIWLFGRNLYIPTMTNTNPFDFLMMSPYFALDILYVYDNTLERNCSDDISHLLVTLNENGKGYFLTARYNDHSKMYSSLAQFLGHPLIRSPQAKAKFSILDLGPQPQPKEIKEGNE